MDANINIPKKVHYCWFGNKAMDEKIYKHISTWKKHLPDWEFICWNEENFDVEKFQYAKEAYENKKYAFVSDVARMYALQMQGGIYLDTDVDILDNFEELLTGDLILAHESEKVLLTAFIAAVPNHPVINEMMELYSKLNFIMEDGKQNCTPNTVYLTDIVKKRGLLENNKKQLLEENIVVYPREVFGAFDAVDSTFIIQDTTKLVHMVDSSWKSLKDRIVLKTKIRLSKILGKELYGKIRKIKKNTIGGSDNNEDKN